MADKDVSNDGSAGQNEPHARNKSLGMSDGVTTLSTALGGAAVGNLIFPGGAGAIVGAVLGVAFASRAVKDEQDAG